MNGLANAILTLLLGWLRSIVDRLWSIVNSDSGSRFFAFLSDNWLTILIVLGIGGFLLDKIIYLIRWRPFTVRRRRQEQQALAEAGEDYQQQAPVQQSAPVSPYAAPSAQEIEPQATQAAAPVWSDPDYDAIVNEPAAAHTAVYSRPAADHSAFRPPMESIEPIFDDQAAWADSDALINEIPYSPPIQPATIRANDQYQQDVQAGFARPIPPEQLYAQPPADAHQVSVTPEPIEALHVHPGLDEELFRRNMGLPHSDEASQASEQSVASAFIPFTKKTEPEQPAKKNRNPFLNLMRLVGDEAARPSIRDLQSTVDVREAFREPVYPQPLYRNEDDPS